MALCRQVFTVYRSALYGIVTKPCVHSASFALLNTKLITQDNPHIETQMGRNLSKRKIVVSNGDASKIIEQMSQIASSMNQVIQKDRIASLQTDSSFISLLNQLEPVVDLMTVKELMESLALLLPVFPRDDNHVVELLEKRALLQMQKKLSISQLVRLVQLHACVATKLRQEVYTAALRLVELRWVEVNTGRDIVALLHLAPASETKLLANIEQKALELCESFSTKELYRTVYCLARMNRRNEPLLRALVYHLGHRELHLSPIHLANLAFSVAKLNLVNSDFMEKIIGAVFPSIETNQTKASREIVISSLSSIIQSFGILRYCNTQLLDTTASFFQNNASCVTANDWHHLLYSAAWLGHSPQSLMDDEIARVALSSSLENLENPSMFLDNVWSCCVLSVVKPELVSKVLDPTFVSNIIEKCASNLIPVYMKLLNVNCLIQTFLPGYAGPLLTSEFINSSMSLLTASRHDNFFDSVFKTLSQMAPAEQYLRADVATSTGCVIDIELLINEKAEPQPLSTDTSKTTCHRVAILLNNFSDMTCRTVRPNGFRSFAARLLNSQGYLVVQIPHTEFVVSWTIVKRVQYLQRKLKDAVEQTKHPSSAAAVEDHTANLSSASPQTSTRRINSSVLEHLQPTSEELLDDVRKKPSPPRKALRSHDNKQETVQSHNEKSDKVKKSLKNSKINVNIAELMAQED